MKTIQMDSLHKKTLSEEVAELVELTQRDPMRFLGRGKRLQVKDLDVGQRLGGVLGNDDPEELKRQQAQYWGVPDETRDAHDYERQGDLEDLAKDNYLGR